MSVSAAHRLFSPHSLNVFFFLSLQPSLKGAVCLQARQQHPAITPSSDATKARSCPSSTQAWLTADSLSGCICYMKPGEHLNLYYVQMLPSPSPAMNFPLPALGCHKSGLFTVQPLTLGCAEVPSLCQSQLTGNGALEGAVMIKSNDSDLVGLRTRLLPRLMAMKTAPHADGNQATEEQQPTDHHHQPGKGEGTELGQKDFVCRGPFKVSPCLK